MDYKEYKDTKKTREEELKLLTAEMQGVANRIFTSPDGKRYAKQMLAACNYFGAVRKNGDELLYQQAQRDFVTTFLINLVKKETLLDILGENND